MGVPAEIAGMGLGAQRFGPYLHQLTNPRGGRQLMRRFHVYLELSYQSKHDACIRARCLRLKLDHRKTDGSQFLHTNETDTAVNGFYGNRAQVVVEVVAAQMVKRWREQGRQQRALEEREALARQAGPPPQETPRQQAARQQEALQRQRERARLAGPHFARNERYSAAVQAVKQSDGYHYEIFYWYRSWGVEGIRDEPQTQTDIYCSFHCYPPSNTRITP